MITVKLSILILVSTILAMGMKTPNFQCNLNTTDVMFSRDYTGVYFDPYVTFQIQTHPDYYDEAGLGVLLKKVNTKFNHIMIGLTDGSWIDDVYLYKPSPMLVPQVSAKINKEMANPQTSLILTIRFTSAFNIYLSTSRDMALITNFTKRIEKLKSVLDKANSIFPGTVRDIIYEHVNFNPYADNRNTFPKSTGYYLFRKVFQNNSNFVYKFALNFDIERCASLKPIFGKFCGFSTDTIYFESFFATFAGVEASTANMLQSFELCRQTWEKGMTAIDKPKISFLTSWSDSSGDEFRFNNTVYFWSTVNTWASERNISVFIFTAFDTFYGRLNNAWRRSGWWKVVPNSSYVDPSQFYFKEKRCIQNPPKFSPKMINNSYLKEPLIFKKNVGTFLQFDVFRDDYQDIYECDTFCLSRLLIRLFSSFSILVLNENENLIEIAQAAGRNNRILERNKTELILLTDYLSMSGLRRKIEKFRDVTHKVNSIYNETVQSLAYEVGLVDYDVFQRVEMFRSVAHHRKDNDSRDKFKFKLVLVIKATYLFDLTDFRTLEDSGILNLVDMILVDMSVRHYDLKQDINQLLLQYTTMFEVCIKLVQRQNENLDLGIVTGWPDKMEVEGLEELLKFVKFWEGVNSWAENKDLKVIMNRGLDYGIGENFIMNGWWRIVKSRETESADTFVYMNKKQIALELARKLLDNLDKSGKRLENIVFVLCAVAMIILIPIIACLSLKKRRNTLDDFVKGSGKEIIRIGMDKSIAEFNWSYEKSLYEISKSNFIIDKDIPLGSGLYGIVCAARIERNGQVVNCAVKMTAGFSETMLKGTLSEIKVLTYLGKHTNVVELIGAYTTELKRKKAYIFLEMCELGSLEGYLQNTHPENLIPNFYKWAYEISNGMEYITSKRIVHLDLATRNVLLTCEKKAKISDFGLSRRLHNYDLYAKKKQEPLPWRWMSIESLKKLEFSEKTDVWAFGITTWEIFSLGELPYKWEKVWSQKFAEHLEQGLRLEKPTYCNDDKNIFPLIQSCWDANKNKRPTFHFLKNQLFYFASK